MTEADYFRHHPERIAATLDNRRFELILLPTEKCNFRCTYCYEDFAIGRMSRAVVNGVRSLLTRRAPSLASLRLSWFGGEPLLAADVVLEISAFAQELARTHGFRFDGTMTTNAWLLDAKLFPRVVEAGVNDFQITLDGPQDVHDSTRKLAGGGRSFETIWNNLVMIRESDAAVRVRLRLHFTRDSFPRIPELVDKIAGELLADPRFAIHFHDVERLGGPNDDDIDPFSPSELEAAYRYLQTLVPGALTEPPEPYICYASAANSLLVRADGRIGKCTVALNDDRNTVGRLLPDGRLELDQNRLWPWLRGIETLDPAVLECPLVGLVTAGAA